MNNRTDIDDSFYENITIGLLSKLRNTPNVSDVQIERRIPCNRLMISAWEHSNNVILPDDLKEFYSATDGFKLIWKYNNFDNVFEGNITINTLSALNKLGEVNREYGSWIELVNSSSFTQYEEILKHKSDIFILNSCQQVGNICLVYFRKTDQKCNIQPASIWLLDKSYQWHPLASDFTVYFRMALVHMGLPQWQFRFTPMGLTPIVKHIMTILIPHVIDDSTENRSSTHRNQLNYNIFKNINVK